LREKGRALESSNIETSSSSKQYKVDFPLGLEGDTERVEEAPYKVPIQRVPFILSGEEPGLLELHFVFRSRHGKPACLDYYHELFTGVLPPHGMFSNFKGKMTKPGGSILRGELGVPARLFPLDLVELRIRNLTLEDLEPS